MRHGGLVRQVHRTRLGRQILRRRFRSRALYNLHPRPNIAVELLAAALNSRIANWLIWAMYTSHEKLFAQLNQRHLLEIPVPASLPRAEIAALVQAIEACRSEAQWAFLMAKLDDLMTAAYGLDAKEKALTDHMRY